MIPEITNILEFFSSVDWDKSTIVLKEAVVDKKCKCGDGCVCDKECEDCNGDCECKTKVTEAVNTFNHTMVIESFSDDPEFPVSIHESDENVFFVKGYEAIGNTCGTGTIHLEDRVSHMNMCETDGVAKVELNVMVEGKKLSNITFILRITEDKPHLLLSKVHLN